jgi:hypothetical protein
VVFSVTINLVESLARANGASRTRGGLSYLEIEIIHRVASDVGGERPHDTA